MTLNSLSDHRNSLPYMNQLIRYETLNNESPYSVRCRGLEFQHLEELMLIKPGGVKRPSKQ